MTERMKTNGVKVRQSAARLMSDCGEVARAGVDQAKGLIAERPFLFSGVAFLAGLALGWIFRREGR